MTTDTKPPVVAYIGARALATNFELPSLKTAIAEFAAARGFVLLMTYVEESRTSPSRDAGAAT
jgi:hypothetical protein